MQEKKNSKFVKLWITLLGIAALFLVSNYIDLNKINTKPDKLLKSKERELKKEKLKTSIKTPKFLLDNNKTLRLLGIVNIAEVFQLFIQKNYNETSYQTLFDQINRLENYSKNSNITFIQSNFKNNKHVNLIDEKTFNSKYIRKNLTGTVFEIDSDLLLFLHIQKTSGSAFERNVIHTLRRKFPKKWKKACKYNNFILTKIRNRCHRNKRFGNTPGWFISRETVRWTCSVHPFLTVFKECAKLMYQYDDESKLKFITLLRNPIERYFSEWKHIQLYGSWQIDQNLVNVPLNLQSYLKNISNLYLSCQNETIKWLNVPLDKFIECRYNLANNRQTKMLAEYDSAFTLEKIVSLRKEDEQEMLKRAKLSLEKMIFFGISEYQKESQILFERSIGENLFKFEIYNEMDLSPIFHQNQFNFSIVQKIKEINNLDLDLYEYGLKLFRERLTLFNITANISIQARN